MKFAFPFCKVEKNNNNNNTPNVSTSQYWLEEQKIYIIFICKL